MKELFLQKLNEKLLLDRNLYIKDLRYVLSYLDLRVMHVGTNYSKTSIYKRLTGEEVHRYNLSALNDVRPIMLYLKKYYGG